MIIATKEDKRLVIDILTSSFIDNKSVNYIVTQNELKIFQIYRLMDYSFEVCLKFGKIFLSEDRKACVLVLYPDHKTTTVSSLWLDLKLINCIGIWNGLKAIKRENKVKTIQPKLKMLYLWFIGVNPAYQNLGLGKRLMEEVIGLSISENRPIYLETSSLENLPWYKKFDFEIYDKLILDYTLYFLERPI